MKPNLSRCFKEAIFPALLVMWLGGGLLAMFGAAWLIKHTELRHPFLSCVLVTGVLALAGITILNYLADDREIRRRATEKAAYDASAPVRAKCLFEETKKGGLVLIDRFMQTPQGVNADREKMRRAVMACADMDAFKEWDRTIGDLMLRAINEQKIRVELKVFPEKRFDFYNGPEWRKLKTEALHRWGNAPCACCGASLVGQEKHVDHIKPRSKYPALSLKISNLQVMCRTCNTVKGNRFEVDFRTQAQRRRFGADC